MFCCECFAGANAQLLISKTAQHSTEFPWKYRYSWIRNSLWGGSSLWSPPRTTSNLFAMLITKGKHPTRGFQQIMKENEQTADIYRNITLGAFVLRPLLSIAINCQLSLTGFTMGSILSNIGIPIILIFLVFIMKGLTLPLYSNTPERRLIDCGYDLNMAGGWGEHIKDAIVLLVLTHILSVASPMFWYLLLLLLLKGLYVSWKYVIRPSFILLLKSGDYPQDNQCGKKNKKNGNKVKKIKYLRTITHWHHFK